MTNVGDVPSFSTVEESLEERAKNRSTVAFYLQGEGEQRRAYCNTDS